MIFKCFAPITGGRVGEIVSQQSKHRSKDSLPLAKEEDKFESFCENYKSFIDVTAAYKVFLGKWEHQKQLQGDKLGEKPILLKALYKSFPQDLFKAFLGKLLWSVLVIFSIWFFVFEILGYIKDKDAPVPIEGYQFYLCAGFFVNMFILSFGIQQMGMYSSILGCKVKAALTTAIYKKMIIRDGYKSKADVVALVAKDVEKISEACLSLQYLWSGIVETIAVCLVTMTLLGMAVLPGVAVMCVFLPLQYWMGLIVAFRKKKLSKVSTKRITLMEEIMRSIKLIKIYGWEASFFQNLNTLRAEESSLLSKINFIQSIVYGLIFSLPPIVACAVFGTQEANGSIEAVVVFTTLSFFNTLRVPFSKLPKSLRDVLDSLAAMERVQDFLLEPELHPELAKDNGIEVDEKHKGIVFRGSYFSYGKGAKNVLIDINLDIPQGSLMMVAGTVASGKSNLLKSILGDLTVSGGKCTESHSRAYVPQTPWTALGTVRDNIVFGLPYDEKFYRQVVYACALETDFKLMADSDQTWIGERGGNLSGGQKQRIALARAAYSRADLYVLDSPLSAVDMYTCQHIFKHCIQDMMLASGGTVVLATHQTELFSFSDHLVVMSEGKQVYNKKYSYQGVKHLFPNMAEEAEQPKSDAEKKKPLVPAHKMSDNQDSALVKNTRTAASRKLDRSASFVQEIPNHKKIKAEPENIYLWYFKNMGLMVFSVATLIFVCGQIVRVTSDNWVSVWSKRKYEPQGYTSDLFYLGSTWLQLLPSRPFHSPVRTTTTGREERRLKPSTTRLLPPLFALQCTFSTSLPSDSCSHSSPRMSILLMTFW